MYRIAYIGCANSAIFNLDVHVILAKFFRLEADKLELVPIIRVVNPVNQVLESVVHRRQITYA